MVNCRQHSYEPFCSKKKKGGEFLDHLSVLLASKGKLCSMELVRSYNPVKNLLDFHTKNTNTSSDL
jgi:hypothetical protein